MDLCNVNDIKALLGRHGFRFSKSMGQNFLIEDHVPRDIAAASGADKDCGVLEIGPGIGPLTVRLAERAGRVVSVELDKALLPVLAETLAEFDNVEILLQDVLKVDLAGLIREKFAGMPVAVCANLPYYITSPILMRLLEEKLPIRHITVMVQKEAAQRITAAPGSREAGAISYAVAYYAKPRLLFSVQPGSFYPPPKVTSAVIQLEVRQSPAVETADEAGFFRLIRAAFSQRRKTAANSVSGALGIPKAAVMSALEAAGLPATARPEQLTLEDFSRLQRQLAAAEA